MEIKYLKVLSSDNLHLLNCKIYIPENNIKGIFQLVHGMTEHIERYDEFLKYIANEGYVCITHDHLGHGKTAKDDSELGFINKKDGYKYLIDDVKKVQDTAKELYKDLPVVLLGHSMGSFVVRLFTEKYKNTISGLIIMGTGWANPMSKLGILITDILIKLKGERYISDFIYKTAFGSFTKRFSEASPYNWLTSDTDITEKYAKDKYCNFRFSVSAMKDLITLNVKCNSKKHFKAFPKDIPVFMVSGSLDPVGNYSKGVIKVKNSLVKNGVKNVNLKFYKNARHEILNDYCKYNVYEDIKKFILSLDNK